MNSFIQFSPNFTLREYLHFMKYSAFFNIFLFSRSVKF